MEVEKQAPKPVGKAEIFLGVQPNQSAHNGAALFRDITFSCSVYRLSQEPVNPLNKIETTRVWMSDVDGQLGDVLLREDLNTFESEQLVHRIFGDGQYLRLSLYNFVRQFPKIPDGCLGIIRHELEMLNVWCETFSKPLAARKVHFFASGLDEAPERHRHAQFMRIGDGLNEWARKMEILVTYAELFVNQALELQRNEAA